MCAGTDMSSAHTYPEMDANDICVHGQHGLGRIYSKVCTLLRQIYHAGCPALYYRILVVMEC